MIHFLKNQTYQNLNGIEKVVSFNQTMLFSTVLSRLTTFKDTQKPIFLTHSFKCVIACVFLLVCARRSALGMCFLNWPGARLSLPTQH